jgi:hypothetical protein
VRKVPNVKKIRGLNLPDPHWPVQACSGTAFLKICFVSVQSNDGFTQQEKHVADLLTFDE